VTEPLEMEFRSLNLNVLASFSLILSKQYILIFLINTIYNDEE